MPVTTCDITWLPNLSKDFQISHHKLALVFCDNKAAPHVATNLVFHEKMKHVEINCHIVREKM